VLGGKGTCVAKVDINVSRVAIDAVDEPAIAGSSLHRQLIPIERRRLNQRAGERNIHP
jgi:hypothetical protein